VSTYADVPAEDWESWVEENEATILDVRQPGEWALGTLPGALLITQFELLERLKEVPKDRPVLCVCRSGARSANVANYLAFHGYQTANMSGGMKALGMQD
jgi:rhodanese-related sulfurtransferase